jgi:hypothetical protein
MFLFVFRVINSDSVLMGLNFTNHCSVQDVIFSRSALKMAQAMTGYSTTI